MCQTGTERTLTLDANVVKYYFLHRANCALPHGLAVRNISQFASQVVDMFPIAVNRFIKSEYERVVGPEQIQFWLSKRYRESLVHEVDCALLPRSAVGTLTSDYGFDCSDTDARYLQTCYNTILKHLVTENKRHFHRVHRRRRRGVTMRSFLHHRVGISVLTVDETCAVLVSGA